MERFRRAGASVGADPSGARTLKGETAFRAANFYRTQGCNHPPWRSLAGRTDARTSPGVPGLAARCAFAGLVDHRRGEPLCTEACVAPTPLWANARDGGFCNALDALFPATDAWLHGHLHAPCDYTVSGCQVVANPWATRAKASKPVSDPMHAW